MRERGVSVILLLRRNPLRRLVSLRANQYDREAKLVDGEHVSHVYSREEVRPLHSLAVLSFSQMASGQCVVSRSSRPFGYLDTNERCWTDRNFRA